jgi:hypothetical protein
MRGSAPGRQVGCLAVTALVFSGGVGRQHSYGHHFFQPHCVHREEALILAANQQRVLGAQTRVQGLSSDNALLMAGAQASTAPRANGSRVRGGVKDRSYARCAGP